MNNKRIKWDITSKCNLRCKHCSVGKKYFINETEEITLDQKLKIIDKIVEGGVGRISILGGEPLMMGDEFFSIIDYGISRGLKIAVATNGIFLNGKILEKFAESGVDYITLSMDGASKDSHEFVRGKNTFEKLIGNIETLTKYILKRDIHLQVNINTVLNRLNYTEIDKIIDICMQLGVNQWTLLSLGCTGFAEDNRNNLSITPQEEIDIAKKIIQRYSYGGLNGLVINTDFYPLLYDYIKEKYDITMPRSPICCNASINLGYIGPDGNMYPCDRFSDCKYIGQNIDDATIKAMSLLNYSFYEIWNSDYFVNSFKLILNGDTYKNYTPCNHCKYLKNGFCNPCPLYSLKYPGVNIEVCQIIEKALGDISDSDKKISLKKELSIFESSSINQKNTGTNQLFDQIADKIPARIWGIRSFEKEDYLILLSPFYPEYIYLNLIGRILWNLIDDESTIQEISNGFIGIISEIKNKMLSMDIEYESKNKMSENIFSFYENLYNLGLLRWVNEVNEEIPYSLKCPPADIKPTR